MCDSSCSLIVSFTITGHDASLALHYSSRNRGKFVIKWTLITE